MTTALLHPLVSIIIPVHNRADLLTETLDSLAAQKGRPLEVVLVDNASTDDALARCEAFKEQMDKPGFRVQVCTQPEPGANKARNTGFNASHGSYVLFFDSDDRLFPDTLSRLIEALGTVDAPDLLVFPYTIRTRNQRSLRRPHRFSAHPAAHLIDPVLVTHNMCLKRELVTAAGGWHPDLDRWQDFEFGFRILLNAGTVCWLKGRPFYAVRDHEASISSGRYTDDLPRLERSLRAVRASIESVEDAHLRASLLRACGYKWASLAGLVNNEGFPGEGARLLVAAYDCLPKTDTLQTKCRSTLTKSLFRFCAWYGGKGGRGCWRLADTLL